MSDTENPINAAGKGLTKGFVEVSSLTSQGFVISE